MNTEGLGRARVIPFILSQGSQDEPALELLTGLLKGQASLDEFIDQLAHEAVETLIWHRQILEALNLPQSRFRLLDTTFRSRWREGRRHEVGLLPWKDRAAPLDVPRRSTQRSIS